MSFCNGGPGTGPNQANLMEWVEQQAVRLSGLPEASTTDQGIAPVSQTSIAASPHEPSAKLNLNLSLAKAKLRVYDIATLYALSKEAARKNIELKIHTDALKGRQPERLEHFKLLFFMFAIRHCSSLRTLIVAGPLFGRLEIFDIEIRYPKYIICSILLFLFFDEG